MKNTLVDAGPLIALFDKSDHRHEPIKLFLRTAKLLMITTWPVLTEACHILNFSIKAQTGLLEWISRGGLMVAEIEMGSLPIIIHQIEKYSNVPMDLADASLLWLAEARNLSEIITFDSDYYIYRTGKKKALKYIFPSA